MKLNTLHTLLAMSVVLALSPVGPTHVKGADVSEVFELSFGSAACSGAVVLVDIFGVDKCRPDSSGMGGVERYCEGGEAYAKEFTATTTACSTLHSDKRENMDCRSSGTKKKFCTIPTAAENTMYDCIVWRYNEGADCSDPDARIMTSLVVTNVVDSDGEKFVVNDTHFIEERAGFTYTAGLLGACSNTFKWDSERTDWSEPECFDPPLSYAEALARAAGSTNQTTTAVPSCATCGQSSAGFGLAGLAAVALLT